MAKKKGNDQAAAVEPAIEADPEPTPATAARKPIEASAFTREQIRKADLLKLIADPVRLQILQCLLGNDQPNVSQIVEAVGHTQPAISHHLGLMKMSGLVHAERNGKKQIYHVDVDLLRGSLDSIKDYLGL